MVIRLIVELTSEYPAELFFKKGKSSVVPFKNAL